MKKRYKIGVAMILILMLFIAGYLFRWDRFGVSKISWQDFFVYDHDIYVTMTVNYYNPCTVEESEVGDEIGKVKYTLQGNVYSTLYKNRNYDASYLPKGTKIYKLKDENIKDQLVVFFKDAFYLYQLQK